MYHLNLKRIVLVGLFLLTINFLNAQGLKNLEEYTLDNGLTVILNQDNTKAEVFGYMVCKAGGKDDPADATGMAHYMEHMLFKGTSKLGTTNWEKEKVHIDKIFELYDQLGKTTDDEERKEIQKKINEQSVEANKYAIPNEFSNIVKTAGGTGLNANTSEDRTVFFHTFPPNQLEHFLELYRHRFEDAVFRSFQAELEVVYEEKNMYADMFFMNILESFQKNFFKNHPYGQQTIIGTVDDLKNPSLTKMYDFYKTWYVPNNMALVLSGDFQTDQAKKMVEKAFGSWEAKEVPERKTWEEKGPQGRELVEVKMSPIKLAILGFMTVPEGHPDELALQVCNSLLSNESGSGIMDQLSLNNEILEAQIFAYPYYDYGVSMVLFVPKIVGQSLEEGEQLILGKIKEVRDGNFEEWQVEAIKKELYRQHMELMEANKDRGVMIGETFAREGNLNELADYPEQIKSISKEDIIEVANKYYGENYLAFFSKMGSTKGEKIDKPGFEPIISNTNAKSEFAKYLENIETMAYKPQYINFDEDVKSSTLQDGVELYVVNNPQNDIFYLDIKFNVGEEKLPMLGYAVPLMDYAFTENFNKSEIKQEFTKLGASYYFWSDDSYVTVSISGIESELEPTLKLVNELINSPKISEDDVAVIYDNEKADRKMEREDPDEVADAAFAWLRYGKESDYIDRLSLKEIKALQANDLIAEYKKATNYSTNIHYSGKKSLKEVEKAITSNIAFNENLAKGEGIIDKPVNNYSENTIYFVNKKKALQSKMYFMANGNTIPVEETPNVEAFNLYFGGGFSGLVLQEIREYRSMAYSAGAVYRLGNKATTPAYFLGYIGTQADKTVEAADVFMDLVRNMPHKTERIEMIKPYLEQSSLTDQPNFRVLSEYMLELKQKGIDEDPAKLFKDAYQNLTFDNIVEFQEKHLKDAPVVMTIVGDKKRVDLKALSKYGKVVMVKEKDLYSK